MAKKLLLITTLLTLTIGLHAKVVSEQMAASKAEQLMKNRVEGFEGKVASVKAVTTEGQKAYYVVQFAPQGWALISADDTSAPLVGYSPEGTYQTENLPDNVRAQMGIYGQQIVDNAHRLSKAHAGWQTEDGMPRKAAPQKAAEKISPLITVNWNQSGSYRKYCPTGTYVGCVAVGMAQAMSVAQHPVKPTGSHGYDHPTYGWLYINYDEEPAYNWATILSSPSSDDVARLLYQCGVSVNMDYGTDGSGAQTSAVATALRTYFGYPQSVKYYTRSSYEAGGGDWGELILNELASGRAVTYSGHDPKKNYGHCFNLDGYDGALFHVNWGWGGSNNGYFGLDGLRDATMDMDYTDGQGVVVGIRPPSEHPSDIFLSKTTVEGNAPAGTEVATVTVESEATNPTYTFTLRGEYSSRTHQYRTAPFKIEGDKLITTEVMDPENGDRSIEITAKNNENGYDVTRTFTIHVTSTSGIHVTTADDEGPATYYGLDGQQQPVPHRGVTIVRNGQQAKKVIIQ